MFGLGDEVRCRVVSHVVVCAVVLNRIRQGWHRHGGQTYALWAGLARLGHRNQLRQRGGLWLGVGTDRFWDRFWGRGETQASEHGQGIGLRHCAITERGQGTRRRYLIVCGIAGIVNITRNTSQSLSGLVLLTYLLISLIRVDRDGRLKSSVFGDVRGLVDTLNVAP